MASINVQPIGDPSGEARCFLLEVEEATILLDVGCDDKFSPGLLDSIARLKNRVDVILLSHPDVQHLAAVPDVFVRQKITYMPYRPGLCLGRSVRRALLAGAKRVTLLHTLTLHIDTTLAAHKRRKVRFLDH